MSKNFQMQNMSKLHLVAIFISLSLLAVSGLACHSDQQGDSVKVPEKPSQKSPTAKKETSDAASTLKPNNTEIAALDPEEIVSHSVKSDLNDVSPPDLEKLEAEVAAQIRMAYEAFEEVLYSKATRTELANGYGTLGTVYQTYEMLDLAGLCYKNATEVLPQDFRWHHLHGIVCTETGELEKATASFHAASTLEPKYVASFVRCGNAHIQLNQLEQARACFDSALIIDSRSPSALAGLADVSVIERNYGVAISHYLAALKEAPFANRLHFSVASAYRSAGNEAEAVKHMEQSGKVGILPGDPLFDSLKDLLRGKTVHLIRGQSAFNAGDFESAVNEFTKAIQASPESAEARVNLGSALGQLGKIDEAIEQYRDAIEIDPTSASAHFNLAVLLRGRQEHKEAIEHMDLVVKHAADDIEARRTLAFSLKEVGRRSEAMDHFQAVLKLAPDDEPSVLAIMEMLIENHQYEDAKTLLVNANRLFPNNGKTAYALATLLASSPIESLRDGQRAVELATAVVKAQRTVLHGETLALALAETGRCDEAAVLQKKLIETATQQGQDEQTMTRLKARLALFEAGSPCRPPIGKVVDAEEAESKEDGENKQDAEGKAKE